jgi:uncharacterized membrane protein
MLKTILLLAFLLSFPLLILWTEGKSKIVRWISPIIICYLVGISIGNIPGFILDRELLATTTMVSVVLAIPLLLFSTHLPLMFKQARPALFSYILGIAGVLICAFLAFWVFKDGVAEAGKISGMMVGVYTGGTQNMSAIGMALGVEEEVFFILNSADIVFSGIYFVVLLTIGKRVMGIFLPRKSHRSVNENTLVKEPAASENNGRIVHVLSGLGLASLLVGISVGISFLITGAIAEPVVILGITTLGIAASFVRKVRTLPLTFPTANYLLLVFALAMGSNANFAELLASSSTLFWFCGFMVFGSILLHFLLAVIFRVDIDTLIITSTAAIFGPAFIGPVANAIGNKGIIPIGIALGLIGYAIGNFLGYGLGSLLN